MRQYTAAFPFFPKKEIDWILDQTRLILEGKKMLSMGDSVKEFEINFSSFCNRKYGIATNSCTSALSTVLKNLNLTPTDEVILPSQTFFANLSSVYHTGAKPVICDTDKNFLLCLKDFINKITPRTKAIIVVHFAGAITPDIFKIRDICKQEKIFLIEDCAHAHGAKAFNPVENGGGGLEYIAGSIGDVACFSFFSTKVMTTGEGGMIVCDDEELALSYRSYANRGINPKIQKESFNLYGENFRLSEFNALLGLSQLRSLDSFLKHRNKIAQIYKQIVKKEYVSFQEIPQDFYHSYWRFIVFLKNHKQKEVLLKLKESRIIADAPYNPLLHQQPLLQEKYFCPNAQALSKTHISLPIHLNISEDDAIFIANTLNSILEKNNV